MLWLVKGKAITTTINTIATLPSTPVGPLWVVPPMALVLWLAHSTLSHSLRRSASHSRRVKQVSGSIL